MSVKTLGPQRREVTCLRPHSKLDAELGWSPELLQGLPAEKSGKTARPYFNFFISLPMPWGRTYPVRWIFVFKGMNGKKERKKISAPNSIKSSLCQRRADEGG